MLLYIHICTTIVFQAVRPRPPAREGNLCHALGRTRTGIGSSQRGFSKGGFSNNHIITTHKLLNPPLLNPPL